MPCGRSNGGVSDGENTGAATPPFAEPKAAAVPFAGMCNAAGTAHGTAAGTGTACAGACMAMGASGRGNAPPASGTAWRGGGVHGETAGIGERRARAGIAEVAGARPIQRGACT